MEQGAPLAVGLMCNHAGADEREGPMPEGSERKIRHALEKLARKEKEEFLRRSSTQFLECAIHLCATHMSLADVADLLEEEARLLRVYQ